MFILSKNNYFALVLALGVLLSLVDVSESAIKCYNCHVCGSGNGEEVECTANNLDAFIPIPTTPLPQIPEKPACVSVVRAGNETHRGCNGLPPSETTMGCNTVNGKKICICNTDLCNGGANHGANGEANQGAKGGANTQQPFQFLILLPGLTTLFAYHVSTMVYSN